MMNSQTLNFKDDHEDWVVAWAMIMDYFSWASCTMMMMDHGLLPTINKTMNMIRKIVAMDSL